MHIKLPAIAFLFFLFSCNSNKESDPKPAGTETSVSTDDNAKPATDIAAQKKVLNEQSLACIALMNALEVDQKAAYAAGDAETAKAIGVRIDSAAMENAKIGQQLMALDNN